MTPPVQPTPVHTLVVEDDDAQRSPLARFLRSLGHDVREAATCGAARAALDAGGVEVVVSDLRLPDADGLELLRWARTRHPLADFLVLTAHGSVETAVEAMRAGAQDFLTKPLDLDLLEQRLARIVERRTLDRELRSHRERARERAEESGVVAASPAMQRVLATVRSVAPTSATVLVTGESGAGKEVVADLVHRWSPRNRGPFVRVNCGALTESLLDAELFGCVRGAFTGADRDRPGLFVEAAGGTLFLDEFGEVSPAMQVKLLRVLQEREVVPVGGARPVKTDARVVAATNRDLTADVREGRFRQDLWYRVAAISVHVPPLRERREDIEALLPLLLRRAANEAGVPPRRLTGDALAVLLAHPFPGNVRELQNVLQRATILTDGDVIRAPDLAAWLAAGSASAASSRPGPAIPDKPLPEYVEEIEKRAIAAALAAHGGVQARAARALGLTERVLRYKLRLYGMDPTNSSRP